MKKIHYLLGLMVLSGAILTSCAKEVELSGPEDGSGGGNGNGDVPAYVVTEDEAVAQVEELMDVLDGTPTRSGIRRRIASVEAVGGSPVTRAAIGAGGYTRAGEEEEPLYWVVNFADNEGFALASGDERTTPVFCITEDGNLDAATLDMDNYTEHPGLGIMFSQYDAEYRMTTGLPVYNYETETWVNPEDEGYPQLSSIIGGPYTPPTGGFVDFNEKAWRTTSSVGEVIPVKWDQGEPYNHYLPNESEYYYNGMDKYYLTGCVAVACATIMAHWEQPKSRTRDWVVMKQSPSASGLTASGQGMVARLMEELGRPQNLDMSYGTASSSADCDNVHRTFENFGYGDGGVHRDGNRYDFNQIVSELTQGRPAIAVGYRNKKTFLGITTGYLNGHAWVVDRVITQKYMTLWEATNNPPADAPTRRLAHCNWGWGGDYDGYFVPNTWDVDNAVIDDPNSGNGSSDWFYQYGLSTVIGMHWEQH